jgi:hypothetical protein
MKKNIIATALLAVLGQTAPSYATNWLELENNEKPGTKAVNFWGFIQPQYVYNQGGPVEGIKTPPQLSAYNGQTALFNLVGPDLSHKDQVQIFRARPGVRGVIPGTEQKFNYFVLAEFGNNGLTEVWDGRSFKYHPVLTDATLTYNTPITRIRVGLGRLPLGEEAMLGEPAMDYVNLTSVSDQLLNERFVVPYYSGRPEVPMLGVPMTQTTNNGTPILSGCVNPGKNCVGATLNGSVGAFRDFGVEAYDWFNQGNWEYSYALMLSDGNGIDYNNNSNYDVTGRLQASYIFGGSGAKRQDASVYAWHQGGQRGYNGQDYSRIREGVGAKYLNNNVRVGGEYIRAKGMIYYGVVAPFNDIGAPAFEPVDQMALASSNKADGYYLDLGWMFMPKWEAEMRYDTLDKLTNSAYDERKASTMTYGLQYFHSSNLRFVVDYEVRQQKVVNPAAWTTPNQLTQLTDAAIIAGSIGNRLDVQLTYSF